ncbi:MAG TPA: PBP1A family penicillin-binding protein [Thermoanaerobaculia bacterium]|nr:PBP1A family penicillin-binding protein [Thermoanaerobaculia bacterium]
MTATVGAAVGVTVGAVIDMPRVDALADFRPARITQLYDRGGRSFSSYARQRRIPLAPHEIPEQVKQAVIAVEDRNFYRHGGLDLWGILRAAVTNFRSGRTVEGASTLTMQLTRQLFLTPEKTFRRKVEEALLAVEIEKNYTKDQILALYLNHGFLGHNQYGIEAASRFFFGKPSASLSVAEAATLVGIFQRPGRLSPYNAPDAVKARRNHVLGRMLDEGFLDREQHRAAVAQPLVVVEHGPREESGAYFAEDIRRHLESRQGSAALLEGGLQVQTTLDLDIQRSVDKGLRAGLAALDRRRGFRGPHLRLPLRIDDAELPSWSSGRAVADGWFEGVVLESGPSTARIKHQDEVYTLTPEGMAWTGKKSPSQILTRGDVAWFRIGAPDERSSPILLLEQEPLLQAAAIVLESSSGAIRAMAGGWDFGRSQYNRATQARRQTGSAFKLFVYGAALDAGFTPADTILDAPVAFRGQDNQLSYSPRNYYNQYYGIVTLTRALEQSFNVTAVKLMDVVGIDKVIHFARQAGVESDLPPYPSLALGAADLIPIELAAAYASIANQGVWIQPYLIEKVETPEGAVLEKRVPRTRKVTSPATATVLRRMLEGVVDRGTARSLSDLDLDIAGKTGTTNDYSNAWFAGFTPRYTICVWVGYDQPRSMGRGMAGDKVAVPIWRRIAEDGLATGWLTAGERFPPPSGVVPVWIDRGSGHRASAETAGAIEMLFLPGTEPEATASGRWATILSLPWYQQKAFYRPKPRERMPATVTELDAGVVEDSGEGGEAPGEEEAPPP